MRKEPTYPITPKTNKDLIPGQFWGVPLKCGKYACGRVLELPPKGYGVGERTHFIVGLMDWVGDELPTAKSIAGHKILQQGQLHVKNMKGKEEFENSFSDQILGFHSLELDAIKQPMYDNRSTWGWDVIFEYAEEYYKKGLLKK